MNTTKAKILFCSLFLISQIAKNCETKFIPPITTSEIPLGNAIQNCRQKCISEILGDFEWRGDLQTYFRCRDKPNCFMCWDYCRAVKIAQMDLAKSMCNDIQYCSEGCKVACSFYQKHSILHK